MTGHLSVHSNASHRYASHSIATHRIATHRIAILPNDQPAHQSARGTPT
jgi:hypothetical protein